MNVDLLGGESTRLEFAPSSQRKEVDILVGLDQGSFQQGNFSNRKEKMVLTSIPCFFNREKIDWAPLEIVRF